jgi:hypothetical protein
MANARPFSISTLQDLSNDYKNALMQVVLGFFLSNSKHSGVPEDSKSPTLGVLSFTPTLGQSGVATPELDSWDFGSSYFPAPTFDWSEV